MGQARADQERAVVGTARHQHTEGRLGHDLAIQQATALLAASLGHIDDDHEQAVDDAERIGQREASTIPIAQFVWGWAIGCAAAPNREVVRLEWLAARDHLREDRGQVVRLDWREERVPGLANERAGRLAQEGVARLVLLRER